MRIRVLASAPDCPGDQQYVTSFLINDTLAIDAGCLGFYRGVGEQERVRHVLLSHTHADHLCSLPVFLENIAAGDGEPVSVYGSRVVLEDLNRHVFNDRIWPDLARIAAVERPVVRFHELTAEQPLEVAGLSILPVSVNHTVPTLGFIVDDGSGAVVFSSDTGPTERLWELARRLDHLRAVFLEASFPDELGDLARITAHLTPRLFARELEKLGRPVPVVAVHIKARHRATVLAQLDTAEIPNLTVGTGGREYCF